MKLFFVFLLFLWIDNSFCDVEQLVKEDFKSFVSTNKYVLIIFKASNECPECNRASKYFEHVSQPDLLDAVLEKRFMIDDDLSASLGVSAYPGIVYFRQGYPALYDGKLSSVDELPEFAAWIEASQEVATKELYDDSFEHLTQASTGATTGDWFVLFYKTSCQRCWEVFPSVESAALRVKYRMNFARIDTEMNKKLTKRFNITKYPTGILFRQGKMYVYEPEKFDTLSLISFVDSWYKNVKASPVPKEPTAFDLLTESIALYIKERMDDPERKWMVIAAALSMSLLLVAMVVCVFRKPADNRRKHE